MQLSQILPWHMLRLHSWLFTRTSCLSLGQPTISSRSWRGLRSWASPWQLLCTFLPLDPALWYLMVPRQTAFASISGWAVLWILALGVLIWRSFASFIRASLAGFSSILRWPTRSCKPLARCEQLVVAFVVVVLSPSKAHLQIIFKHYGYVTTPIRTTVLCPFLHRCGLKQIKLVLVQRMICHVFCFWIQVDYVSSFLYAVIDLERKACAYKFVLLISYMLFRNIFPLWWQSDDKMGGTRTWIGTECAARKQPILVHVELFSTR